MQTVFNLDLNKKNPPTSFAYQVPTDTQEMYFRIIENDYVIDYSRFKQLTLQMELPSGAIYTQSATKLTTYQNEKVVLFKIPSGFLNNTGVMTISPRVSLNNKTVILPSFKIYLYDAESSNCLKNNMRNVLSSINHFNYMLSLYYDSIKRDQINQPNGVVGLDSNGNIPLDYFPTTFTNHISDKLIDTATTKFYDDNGQEIGIHGLKLDDKWRLRYYDHEDLTWRIVNSIYGGDFGVQNKSSEWNVFGGSWNIANANTVTDAGIFTNTVNNFVDGNTFKDTLSGDVDSNFIDGGVETGENIFGGTFK